MIKHYSKHTVKLRFFCMCVWYIFQKGTRILSYTMNENKHELFIAMYYKTANIKYIYMYKLTLR